MMEKVIVNTLTVVVGISQLLAMLVISIGILKAMWIYIKDVLLGGKSAPALLESRLELGHAFSLGLGFLIGASILQTVVAPNWNDIGQLAAVIAIRTVLNYFLLREISTFSPENSDSGSRFAKEKSADTCGFETSQCVYYSQIQDKSETN